MSSAEKQELDISKLNNTSLNKIEKELVLQRSLISSLDEERQQMFQKIMSTLHLARAYNIEAERIQLEGVKLSAKRNQQKKQLEDITNSLKAARATQIELELMLKQEELDIDTYEKPLQELANQFRQSAGYYNEKKMKKEVEMLNENILGMQNEEKILQKEVTELENELNNLDNNVPENILEIVFIDQWQPKETSYINQKLQKISKNT